MTLTPFNDLYNVITPHAKIEYRYIEIDESPLNVFNQAQRVGEISRFNTRCHGNGAFVSCDKRAD